MVSASTYLRALLAAEGGSISVERFMQEALYHPEFGYYARRVGTVGRTGDFSTSASLHPALGQAIARWTLAHRSEVTCRGRWHLIELGGGTGEMASTILRTLGWWGRSGLRYHLVEVSAGLQSRQRARLSPYSNVFWHSTVQSALAAAAGQALLFSNEFIDAFPCLQWQWDVPTARWREVRVTWPDNAGFPQETTTPWLAELPSVTSHVPVRAGQRVEAHFAYRRWLDAWVNQWQSGRLLTIDYGDTVPALYNRQPHGTLRAYCRHQRFVGTEVYRRFGQQDLTADVNFSDLQAWGEAVNLAATRFETQAEFLRRLHPAKSLRTLDDARLGFLLDPAGAGSAFKVLEQTPRARK